MPFYDVDVDETRHYVMCYRIEADSPEQAVLMAEEGCSTHGEKEISLEGVINRGVDSNPALVPVFIAVEYDLDYWGGDYDGLGEEALLPIDGLTDDNLKERFQKQTGHDPTHVIHYTFDEPVDANGDELELE